MTVKGDKEVLGRLQAELNAMGGAKAERAITEILIAAQGYSAEITPVATSNLINSQFRRVTSSGRRVTGVLGYGADYAIYVHDAQGKLKGLNVPRSPKRLGFVWSPNGEPEFLEKGVREAIQNDAIQIINRVMGYER